METQNYRHWLREKCKVMSGWEAHRFPGCFLCSVPLEAETSLQRSQRELSGEVKNVDL